MHGHMERFYKEHRLFIDVLLIALILRLVFLNAVAAFVFDETYYVPSARALLQDGIDTNPEHPPLVKLVLAASIALLGDNPISWRLPSMLAGMAGAFFFYFIALEISKNKKVALLSAALLAFDPLNVLLSRTGMLDIFMLAFPLAGTFFLLKKNYPLAGLLFGLGIASKWPAALMFLAAVIFLLAQKKLEPRRLAVTVGFAAAAYLLVSLPFILSEGPAQWFSSQTYYIGKLTKYP